MRLCWQYVNALKNDAAIDDLRGFVNETYTYLVSRRNSSSPYYGEDLWDWAYILEAMVAVVPDFETQPRFEALRNDLGVFYKTITTRLSTKLYLGIGGEWYGPAVPTAAYRLLNLARAQLSDQPDLDSTLAALKAMALEPLKDGQYFEKPSEPRYAAWHLGQVASEFQGDSAGIRSAISDLHPILTLQDPAERTYALARVLQGLGPLEPAGREALKAVVACETTTRPLGTGILADNVKASLNVLEGIWFGLDQRDLVEINSMLNALLTARRRSNRVGILVALDREQDACLKQFRDHGATITPNGDVFEIDHSQYQAVVVIGKSILESAHATIDLVRKFAVTRVVVVGIAGSLGTANGTGEFTGPDKGDVVIATSNAAYRVREKARVETKTAAVPFAHRTWSILPCDTAMFALAHREPATPNFSLGEYRGRRSLVHEGLIVTGNGIKDHPEEKRKVLQEWPGGLAVAEEGFPAALECHDHGIPYLEIRGISDRAEGDKLLQQGNAKDEEEDQQCAANNAAKVVVHLVSWLFTPNTMLPA